MKRGRDELLSYQEASSDDEFANKHFILPNKNGNPSITKKKSIKKVIIDSDEEDTNKHPMVIKVINDEEISYEEDDMKSSSSDSSDDEKDIQQKISDSEDGDSDNDSDSKIRSKKDISVEYRIQHILGRKAMNQKEWRKICDNLTTYELTKCILSISLI